MTQRRSNPPAANNIRRKLEAEFKRPIPERMWQYLLALGVIEDYLACPDSDTWQNVKWHCREQFALVSQRRPAASPPRRGMWHIPVDWIDRDDISATYSRIIAAEVNRLPEVMLFRAEVLGGKLLAPDDIPAWLKAREAEQGLPTRIARVEYALPNDFKIPRGGKQAVVRALSQLASVRLWVGSPAVETLTYEPEGSYCEDETVEVSVRYRSPLWRLKRLAEYLTATQPLFGVASLFGGELTSAIRFLLSGTPPAPFAMTVYYTERYLPRCRIDFDVRIPLEVIRGSIAGIYKIGRLGARCSRHRNRFLSEKHGELAVYLAEHFEMPWPRLMESWNEEYPKWAYANWRTFARDAKAAWCRVTGRKWTPRRARKERTQNAEEES